jgi:hypothetical protein
MKAFRVTQSIQPWLEQKNESIALIKITKWDNFSDSETSW